MAKDKQEKPAEKIYVRVTPRAYLAAGFFLLFFSAFLFYLDYSLSGFILFAATLIGLPFLAYFDRIWFDGRRLRRTGLVPSLAARLIGFGRSEEHTSELQSPCNLVCRLLLEKKK